MYLCDNIKGEKGEIKKMKKKNKNSVLNMLPHSVNAGNDIPYFYDNANWILYTFIKFKLLTQTEGEQASSIKNVPRERKLSKCSSQLKFVVNHDTIHELHAQKKINHRMQLCDSSHTTKYFFAEEIWLESSK